MSKMAGQVVVAVWAACVWSGFAGTLESPAAATSTNSAMYTLQNIYDYLTTGVRASKRTGGFAEPVSGPTSGTMRTLNDIMNAGIIPPRSGQTTSYVTGDDGSLQRGLAWPNPRFTVGTNSVGMPNDTNCVTDNLTGLMWTRNANLASNVNLGTWSSVNGACTWYQAFDVVTNSAGPVNGGAGYGGYHDWRLPNIRELLNLVDLSRKTIALCNTAGTGQWANNDPFTGVLTVNYWSSTTYATSVSNAMAVYLANGIASYALKTNAVNYVWAVRGGQ